MALPLSVNGDRIWKDAGQLKIVLKDALEALYSAIIKSRQASLEDHLAREAAEVYRDDDSEPREQRTLNSAYGQDVIGRVHSEYSDRPTRIGRIL
jgi:hypothetical protein